MSNSLKSTLKAQLRAKGVLFTHQVGEVGLVYKRKHEFSSSNLDKITCSGDAAHILYASYEEGEIEVKEYFKVLLLNRANKVVCCSTISEGGVSGTVADPKIIFETALISGASSIVLCHNHPSGNLKPSQADLNLTTKLVDAGKLLELPILDHIILSAQKGYYLSFMDEGLM